MIERLSDEFLASCRRDGRRILRGESMTRIETFVDAAFAFAFTMLVISIDEIPRSPVEMLQLSEDIPAFVFSACWIGIVWMAQTNWSRHFGLQDRVTQLLLMALVVLVLIFVYPIKLMMQATVLYFSEGAIGPDLFSDPGWDNNSVSSLFAYFSLGLLALSSIIVMLYRNALRHREELVLNDYEVHLCSHACIPWLCLGGTAVASVFIATMAPREWTVSAGFIYMSLWLSIPLAERLHLRISPEPA